ncbi:MAG: barstar family protein [Caldilineaceae bacterium]|nr:barstar family protein [Caldilineaceae bacterium]
MIPRLKSDTSNPVERILAGELAPGLYRLRSELNADHIVAPLNKVGWRGFYIEGQIVENKADFLRIAGAAMSFPDYSGQNWDAFEESIRDLGWVRAAGYVLIYDNVWYFPRQDRAAWREARSILADAVDFWAKDGTPFYVFLRHTWWYAHDLPRI